MHPNTTTLFPENPPAVTSSALSLDAPGLPAQGDFLFSDDAIVNWFDSQTEDTCRFWIDQAVEMFGLLPDSATPRQCWEAFWAFATRGVLAPPDDPAVDWFDAQSYATRFFWIDRASEQLGLSDYSATERQCWDAFCAFATRGLLAPQLLTHAAVIRKHGQPLFTVHCPPGMLHLGNVAPFWSVKAFEGYLAALRARGYFVTLSGPSVAFVLSSRGAA